VGLGERIFCGKKLLQSANTANKAPAAANLRYCAFNRDISLQFKIKLFFGFFLTGAFTGWLVAAGTNAVDNFFAAFLAR
jgi:hypothetical protein